MRFDESTNTVHKCIHEALDYDWCNCSDFTREDLNVKLPKPEDHSCDSCSETQAIYVLQMTNSLSMDNLFYACRQCAADVFQDWMWAEAYEDTEGWEIRKI